jgi:hypothetical protein
MREGCKRSPEWRGASTARQVPAETLSGLNSQNKAAAVIATVRTLKQNQRSCMLPLTEASKGEHTVADYFRGAGGQPKT